MVKNILIGITLLFTFVSADGQSQPLAHIIPISWTAETRLFSQDSNWEYFLAEDNEYIYLGLLIPPGKESQQMLMTGLTVWFGKKEAHKQAVGVRFPLGFPKEEVPNTAQELKTTFFNWKEKKEAISKSFSQLELINRNGKMDTILGPTSTVGGVMSNCLFEGGFWVYELAVPKKAFPQNIKDLKKHNVVIMTGALKRPRDLQGTDAVGFANSQLYRMGSNGKKERERISDYYYYSDFTSEVKRKIKKANLNF
ncbi:MAG: hypothetical protein MRZ79_25350 [Bacteroidia bacterium]|nr:hypothetical protein [Bacteroidia bacterium]